VTTAAPGREAQEVAQTLSDVRALVHAGCFKSAAQRVGELRLHLEQHLAAVGRLAPIYLSRTGDPGGLCLQLAAVDDEIPKSLQGAFDAITHWEPTEALAQLDVLAAQLEGHQAAEQRMLHPTLEDLVPEDVDWSQLHLQLLHARRGS
jgi:hypothetical protein